MAQQEVVPNNFVKQIIQDDLKAGKHQAIVTRFPPEPNGFLHLGHAKSICLNFGLARDFGGICHLRFDDTNPEKEEQRYIDSIMGDIRWLGFSWGENLFYASDYFDTLYGYAEKMVRDGVAYVDDQTPEEVRENRGNTTTPGVDSPFRNRTPEENMKLFHEMRDGLHPDGSRILRAKIDMAHANPLMRDPPLYRIKREEHPRTGSKWIVYPLYDFAHGQSDSIEHITHSVCTLEFEVHRPLYDWFQKVLSIFPTRQIEFARLNVTYMVMSKRKLQILVNENWVDGWDDPRLPTIAGMRRRGYPARAIRDFAARVGVAKRNNTQNFELLETCVREALQESPRRMAVINPLKVIIDNWTGPEQQLQVPNHPDRPEDTRTVSFGKEVYVDRDDFVEVPPPKWFRLAVGAEVRLKYGYWIRCTSVEKVDGEVVALHCSFDPTTKGGNAPADGRKVKGTLHWLGASEASPVRFNMYDRLFSVPEPEVTTDKPWTELINPQSLVVRDGLIEKSMLCLQPGEAVQCERVGFFTKDENEATFNLTVPLQDSWAEQSNEASNEAKKKAADKQHREAAAAERAARKKAKCERAAAKRAAKSAEEAKCVDG